jgi:hypothetical protein
MMLNTANQVREATGYRASALSIGPKANSMKLLAIIIICAAVLMCSCTTTPLSTEADGQRLAQIMGVSRDSVQFISYCCFAETRGWDRYIEFTSGILAVTNDGVHILGGDLTNASKKREIVLRYDQLTGVELLHFGAGRQLQIWTSDHVIAIEITATRTTMDHAASEQVFQSLKARGVAQRTDSRFFFAKAPPMIFIPIPVK